MSDATEKATDTPTATATATPGPPVLMGDHIRVEVVVTPPPGSPFGPITMQVVPFTRAEQREYEAGLKDKTGAEFEKVQCQQLANRIKSWNVQLAPGTPAEVNAGTVARLPTWAFNQIESALYGEAGKLLGN